MRTYAVLVLFSGVMLFTCCVEKSGRAASGKGLKVYQCAGFSVECPKWFKIKVGPEETIDFFIYQFIDNGKILLCAYSGNDPSLFQGAKEEKPDKEEMVNGLTYKFYSTKDVNGTPMKQVLVKMPITKEHPWPEYLHFWYFGLSPEEQQVADAIILSARPE